MNKIPKDPMILFSFVNTQLRDRFSSLEEMCREMELDQSYIEETLEGAGFSYDPKTELLPLMVGSKSRLYLMSGQIGPAFLRWCERAKAGNK